MIKSSFSKYFTDQQALDSISVTEIENLIAETPASGLYRLLLTKKMQGLNLHDAALLCTDRLLLEDTIQDRIQQVPVVQAPRNGTINHIVSIPVFQEEILPKTGEVEQLIKITSEPNTATDDVVLSDTHVHVEAEQSQNEDIEDIIVSQQETKTDTKLANDTPIVERENLQKTIDSSSNGLVSTINRKSGKSKKHKFRLNEYSGLSEYALWLLSFKQDDIEKQLKKEAKKAEKRKLEASARKSVTKSDEIISESLAKMLENQGHLDDAKKMYEQLMHKYPEKSRYFAAKIDNLIKSL